MFNLDAAIKEQIDIAIAVKNKHGFGAQAVIRGLLRGNRFVSVGFNFDDNVKIGDIINCDDGNVYKALAVV